MSRQNEMKQFAMLLINLQNDFCFGGALAVPDGDAVIKPINRLALYAGPLKIPIFASCDWHPENTKHFDRWPRHCVASTPGAELHPDLVLPDYPYLVAKGMSNRDGYSAFEGFICRGTKELRNITKNFWKISLHDMLSTLAITDLFVAGLTTDYCVRTSVLDGLKRNYRVFLALDACRAVNMGKPKNPLNPIRSRPGALQIISDLLKQEVEPTDENISIEEMRRAGAIITTTDAILEIWTRPDD